MNVYTLCATRRGLQFLRRLLDLAPEEQHFVFSFRETSWEPAFLTDIRGLAQERGAVFHQTTNVSHPRFREVWEDHRPDLIFLVSWRYLIPMALAERARIACVVFHDSLLPHYRGFSPTPWAILNGERETGVSLFHLAEEVDSGDLIDQKAVPIGPAETIAQVMERVTEAYLELLERNWPDLRSGRAPRTPQDATRATYTCRRLPADNEIDWSASTARIHDLIRATTRPYPGAFTWLEGRRLVVWSARRIDDEKVWVGRIPGRVAEVRPGAGTVVLTGDGSLLVQTVQLDDGPETRAQEVLNSPSIRLGRVAGGS